MTCKELCERFNISVTTINELKKANLINCKTFDNSDIDRLNKILTLKNAGVRLDKIKSILELQQAEDDSTLAVEDILLKERRHYTEKIHSIQKYLDRLDYLIYDLNH